MLTTISNKIKFQNGVVVILDALGTKGIWRNEENALRRVSDWTDLMDRFDKYIVDDSMTDHHFRFDTFSDTVIITGESDDQERLLYDTGDALCNLLVAGMAVGIFFRGGVAVGEFYHDNKMIIGPAVDEADQYYILPQWIGITAAPSAHEILSKMKKKQYGEFDKIFCQYDIPLKNTVERDGWALNWPVITDEIIKNYSKTYSGKVDHGFHEIISEQFSNSREMDIVLKWRNTRRFFNEIRGV